MKKQVLIISGSPREGGNSDTLCDEFQRGCQEAGHQVRKVSLQNRKIQFCTACYACKKLVPVFKRTTLLKSYSR